MVGQLTLTRFINEAGLLPIGDNMFTETPASGTPQDGLAGTDGVGSIQQGNLEQSNVDFTRELDEILDAAGHYDLWGLASEPARCANNAPKGCHVEMVHVRVGEKDDVDGGQLLDEYAGSPLPAEYDQAH